MTKKISQLPSATVTIDDIVPLVDNTVTSRTTLQVIYNLFKSLFDVVYQPISGYTPEDIDNKSISVVTDQASDTKYPSVKSVYTWATGLFATLTGAQTITNKRNTRRVLAVTQSATPATNTDNGDIISITAIAQNITSMTSGLTGTPVNGDMVMWQLTATGSFTLAWGASFVSTTNGTLPTAISTTMIRTVTQWNSVTSKWECIA